MRFTPKRKPDVPDVVVRTPSLAEEIERVHGLISNYLDDRLAELKQTKAGAGLPVDWLKQDMLRGLCPCFAAKRLIDNG
jgi:hypothetical protein